MSDQDTFLNTDEQTEESQNTNPETKDSNGDPISQFVGEGKKYRDTSEFVKGFGNAQSHIQKLEEENKQFRAKLQELDTRLQEAKTLESVLDEIRSNKTEGVTASPDGALSRTEVMKLMQEGFTQWEDTKRQSQNKRQVDKALVERYGEKTDEVVAAKAIELGMSVQDMVYLAKRSPNAVLAYFQDKTSGASAPKSTVNTSTLPNNATDDTPRWRANRLGGSLVDEWKRLMPKEV